jgi:hypothetical protein
MPTSHSKATIISLAVIASATATLLHEGVGHGITAWLRGDIPTELTSNHLSALRPDRWVDVGGTLVNLFTGSLSLFASRRSGSRANLRYFLWIFAAFNLLSGTGYFMFSGIFGFGDWNEVIRGLPRQFLIRVIMTLFGGASYFLVVQQLAIAVRSFVPTRSAYNAIGRLPYLAAGVFSALAGAFDPLGVKLLLVSTIPAAFGGSSGLLWADNLMPHTPPEHPLFVKMAPACWIAAAVLGIAYIFFLGRGIQFAH